MCHWDTACRHWLVNSYCIQFTDGTVRLVTTAVVPFIRVYSCEPYAPLQHAHVIIRLSLIPVAVSHDRHRVTVRICRCQSPDECGIRSRVDTLSRRPEHTACSLRCLWKYNPHSLNVAIRHRWTQYLAPVKTTAICIFSALGFSRVEYVLPSFSSFFLRLT